VDGWNAEGLDEIIVGKRRLRAKRRRNDGRGRSWATGTIIVALVGLIAGGYYWFTRPTGLAAIPYPAVVAPGGYRALVGDKNTITVGLEVRNVADAPVTLLSARITPPSGLTQVDLSIMSPGPDNEGFALDGDLATSGPVELGTGATDRNAVIVARFRVSCHGLPASDAPTGEEIFVTIQVGSDQRVEELTPPAVGDVQWLTATALRLCQDPVSTGSAPPPLPPLPAPTAGSSP
jgi:hypothetical protein